MAIVFSVINKMKMFIWPCDNGEALLKLLQTENKFIKVQLLVRERGFCGHNSTEFIMKIIRISTWI